MAPTENDSDTRLFRFDKKMFLELASDDEQDNSHAYGNVVTQIYIEEKDGTELKNLKDEKQVSDLKRELQLDDLQNTEVIETRKKEKEIERVKKERKIINNDMVTSLTKYNKIFKNITIPKLKNYMMYLDIKISIDVEGNEIVVSYDNEPVKDKIDSIDVDDVNKIYIKTIIKKKYSRELKDIISKRSNFINNDLPKIKLWEDDNNIISNNLIDDLILAKERLDMSTAEAKVAEATVTDAEAAPKKAADAEAAAEGTEAAAAPVAPEGTEAATAAADSVAEAKAAVEAAKAAVTEAKADVEAANTNLTKYIDARKSSPPFDDKIKNVKDYLTAKDNFNNKDLIKYAELNETSYQAIKSINTLDEDVHNFNRIFHIKG